MPQAVQPPNHTSFASTGQFGNHLSVVRDQEGASATTTPATVPTTGPPPPRPVVRSERAAPAPANDTTPAQAEDTRTTPWAPPARAQCPFANFRRRAPPGKVSPAARDPRRRSRAPVPRIRRPPPTPAKAPLGHRASVLRRVLRHPARRAFAKLRLHVNTDSVLEIIARRDALHRWSLAAIGPLGNCAALDESLNELGASDTENDAGR